MSFFSTEKPPGCLEAVARELVAKDGDSKHTAHVRLAAGKQQPVREREREREN